MDIIHIAIVIIAIVAVIAIVTWFVRSSGITIPQPFMIAFYAVIAIVAILLIVKFVW